MRSMVYETVETVCPSIDRSTAYGGFAAERPTGRRYRSITRRSAAAAPQHGAQQRMRVVSC